MKRSVWWWLDRLAIISVLILVPVFGFWALFLEPVGAATITYQPVVGPDELKRWVNGEDLPGNPTGEFAVHDGKLYLRVQSVQGTRVITMIVKRDAWTSVKLARFRSDHPGLERYLPDPKAINAGVSWIKP